MSSYLTAVRAATTTNIPALTGTNPVDGVPIAVGDRVLVKDQTAAENNGIYKVGAPWHRAADLPAGPLAQKEVALRVSEGTTYAHTEWYLADQGPITIGSTPLTFAQSVGFRAAALALPDDGRVYHVSTNANASDTNDGLSPTSAFRTIDQALAALGTNPGVIQLAAGMFEAPDFGIALFTRQALQGVGGQVSRIRGDKVTAGAVVSLTGSRSQCRDLWITFVPPNKTGLRVTTEYPLWAANTFYKVGRLVSHEDAADPTIKRIYKCTVAGKSGPTGPATMDPDIVDGLAHWAYVKPAAHSAQNVRVDNIFIDALKLAAPGNHTVGFGIGDDTSLDVSEVCLVGCRSNGNSVDSIHMLLGNGTTGNVCDISNFGGAAAAHQYGVMLAGGTLVSRGLNFGQSTEADINLHRTTVGSTSIVGGRSENSKRFLVSDFGALADALRVADYTVVALQNFDGQAVQLLNASITLDNILLSGDTSKDTCCPQYVWVNRVATDNDVQAIVSTRNLATDHPHPFQSPWAHPGLIINSEATRFIGDPVNAVLCNRRKIEHWTRRHVITSANPYVLDPANFEAVDIRLGAKKTDAGPFTLKPGIIGQRVSICFEQDGVGGWSYSWPALCAFSGGMPAMVTTARNRQTCEFRWTGRFWEQHGPVTNVTPPAIPAVPVTSDHFSSGTPYWLDTTTPPGPLCVGTRARRRIARHRRRARQMPGPRLVRRHKP
jgi:hypothetical protein